MGCILHYLAFNRRRIEWTSLLENFLEYVPDEELGKHLAAAEAFVLTSYEDFGIAPLEAMAVGTPVIAYKGGGALDYVIPGKTGAFFAEQTVESLKNTLQTFERDQYSNEDIHKASQQFSAQSFREKFWDALNSNYVR